MSDQHHPTRKSGFWTRLTEPDASIQDPEQRQQAQFLASLFLVLSPIGILGVVLPAIGAQDTFFEQQSLYVYLLASLTAAMAYFVSRTRWYKLASWGAVGASSVAIILSVFVDPTPQYSPGLFYLIIPVLLSGILLSLRAASVLAFLQIAVIMILPLFVPDVTWHDTISYPLAFNLIAALVILMVARQRMLISQDRETDLEEHITARTEELSRVNHDLKAQVAERQQAEKSLDAGRNLLRTLIDIFPDDIYVKDLDSQFVLLNISWAKNNAGTDKVDQVVGKTDYDFFDKNLADEFFADEQHLMATGHPLINKEEVNRHQNQEPRWVQSTKVPLRDPEGRVIGLVGISRNITRRKHIEDDLKKAHDELEQRVKERTEELSRANTELQRQVTERLQAEEQLRYQANLIQNITDAIIATDMQLNIQSWNQAAEQIYGWTEAEAAGQHVNTLLKATFAHSTPQEVHEQYLENGYWRGEVTHTRKDGTPIHILSSVSIIRDAAGTPIGSVGVNRDITNHKLAETAEREQRLLAEALRDTAAAINSTLDFQEVLDRILIQLERVVPYDSANVMLIEGDEVRVVHCRGYVERGFAIEDVLALRFSLPKTANLYEMYKTGQPCLVPNTREYAPWIPIKETIWVLSYIGVPIQIDGQVIGFVSLDNAREGAFTEEHAVQLQAFANQAAIAIENARLYDAVKGYASELEQRVAERTAQLEHQRAQLQTILDAMSEGVLGIMYGPDMQPQTRLMNRALTELIGYTAEDWDFNLLRSQEMSEEEASEVVRSYNRAIERTGFWQNQLRMRRKDGTEFDGDLTVRRVTDSRGGMIGVVIVVRDVSQEKMLQEQRSRFVANASHELRTPITNLLTRLYLLRKQPERLPEHMEILENVVGRMRNLVEDLLEHSRFERGVIPLDRQILDLRMLIGDIIRIQKPEAESKRIRLDYRLPELPFMVYVDAGRMTQVLTNLITNAINYTPEGGQVTIESAIEPDEGEGEIFGVIHVTDSGIGIAPDMLPNIFRPFYRGNEHTKGTGLGLSIAKEIIEMHGGRLSVESHLGQGSRFTLRLALVSSLTSLE